MAPPLEHDLPLVSVTRVAKKALPDKANLSKEAKETVQAAAAVFVLYLTSAAGEECKMKKRQTMSAKDVIKALHDVDMEMLISPVESFLQASKVAKKAPAAVADDDSKPVDDADDDDGVPNEEEETKD
ncbi:Aste57867_19851 [Aphanomyces stellatus]|uniref:Aste57867_19851 protein n=1 Tax=Aphanomyces stellatus TaxID=120398 RepID=A0A485LES1_9STRA|nr:hypothetical protein As57867_019786 [Aphanomyces stellatus]VFT96549.1 Aste57867_19851 [Aphanomyces stellatus]